VHSLPSFVAQGEFGASATAADVIEVECNPAIYGTGSPIRVTAAQLFSRCGDRLTWIEPNPYTRVIGKGITVRVDADGNATVAVIAGPECQVGESLVTVHEEAEPFETATTDFTVLPPAPTKPGVEALPASQVEDSFSSGVVTILQGEFAGGSEKPVRFAAEELFNRCRVPPKLRWLSMFQGIPGITGPEIVEMVGVSEVNGRLDNDGNAFVVVVGDASCAEGPSLIEADLLAKPFTTFTTDFTVEPPKPTPPF
jgi:hypothetical protein